jgi:RNA polymerase sigma factor (sigma-70 family)
MWKKTPPPAATCGASRCVIDWQVALEVNHRWLRTVVYTRLREPQAVDEVMQEVALAAVRQAAPLADPAKAAPWLYRLAVRQALLFRRKCGRRRRLTNQYAERVAVVQRDGASPSPLDWLLLAERQQVVRDALERLAARDAEILLLKYGEGWSYHQIAAHLGVSHSAVETRLHRARSRLREELLATRYVEVG